MSPTDSISSTIRTSGFTTVAIENASLAVIPRIYIYKRYRQHGTVERSDASYLPGKQISESEEFCFFHLIPS